jgi:hypothetical protein
LRNLQYWQLVRISYNCLQAAQNLAFREQWPVIMVENIKPIYKAERKEVSDFEGSAGIYVNER